MKKKLHTWVTRLATVNLKSFSLWNTESSIKFGILYIQWSMIWSKWCAESSAEKEEKATS